MGWEQHPYTRRDITDDPTEHDDHHSDRSASDAESHAVEVPNLLTSIATPAEERLEVLFAQEELHRRKSSLVPADVERPTKSAMSGGKPTQCYVHALFEEQQKKNGLAFSSGDGPHAPLAVEKAPHLSSSNISGTRTPESGGHQPRHSRLLTKKQLSEMAYGIRELSKKLAHIQIKIKVRNIFILSKAHDETLIKYSRELTEWLLKKDPEYMIYVEDTLKENTIFDMKGLKEIDQSAEKRVRWWDNDLCRRRPQTFDIILSLGGDGTVLYASWLFQRVVPPVLSFAMGSLGFLTKFDFGGFEDTLSSAFKNGITASLRLRFEGTVMRSTRKEGDTSREDIVEELIGEESEDAHTHRPDGTHNVLNEIVIDRGPNPTMSTLEIFGDNDHYTTIQADGVCVATPTGSTAYNLAAGGSLCHPDNPVILFTAICAHTLNFRPVILPDTIVMRIAVPYDARTSSWASFDGRER